MEQQYQKFYKIIIIISSIICIVFFGLAAIEEQVLADWKTYQKKFKELLKTNAKTERQKSFSKSFPVEIKQIVLPHLGRIDRCVSCHNGIENPSMKNEPLPHTTHSGDYLKHHPVENFGCSICHDGQGRALTFKEAKATAKDIHWEYPLLSKKHMQSSCGRCHLSAFDKNQTRDGAAIFVKGRGLFLDNGCLGCHKVRLLGGSIGPELTDEGAKTVHEFDFSHITGEKSVSNWLKEHFKNPQKFTSTSTMPALDLGEDDLNALTTFVMGLNKPGISTEYLDLDFLREFKGKRINLSAKESYKIICASCHGENGEGKDYRIFEEAVPSLNNSEFLAVASLDMIRKTITDGREGRMMPQWILEKGGLSKNEIDALAFYIIKWKNEPPPFQEVLSVKADKDLGKTLYRGNCGICHGANGEGGIGPSLNNQGFLPLITKEFLYKTLVNGRENTAMLSWTNLDKMELAGIIEFVKSWQKKKQVALSGTKISGDIKNGKDLYARICSQCHGINGQGTVGPALFNKNFLKTASDEFILETASKGRENTAMISWIENLQGMAQLSPKELKDIISFIRTQELVKTDVLYNNIVSGTVTRGYDLYNGMCGGCHGINGEGKHGPALNNQAFLSAATNGFLQATIAFGRNNTAMRSWAKGAQGYAELNEIDINDIISYIRNWQK